MVKTVKTRTRETVPIIIFNLLPVINQALKYINIMDLSTNSLIFRNQPMMILKFKFVFSQ